MSKSSDAISSDASESGSENCPDCLAQLRNDIVDIENIAREMMAEYQAARAKMAGTEDFVVVSGKDYTEGGSWKGKEVVRKD